MRIFLALFCLVPLLAQSERKAGSFTVLSTQVVPLIIVGEGWSQRLILNNVDQVLATTGTIRFYRKDGSEWPIALADGQTASSFPLHLRPGQSTVLTTQAVEGEQQLGWAIIALDQSRGNLFGQLVFQKKEEGQPDLMTGVLLSDRAFFRTTTFFDNTAGNATGFGVLIPQACPTVCTDSKPLRVTVYDLSGTVLATRMISQTSGSLNWMDLAEQFPETVGQMGTVVVQPDQILGALLSGFSLHFTPNRAFVAIAPYED